MKNLFLSSLMTMTSWTAVASVATELPVSKTPVLGVIANVARTEFDSKYQTFFKGQWQSCSSCEVLNLTPYNEKGELNREGLAAAIEKARGQVPLLYVGWNEVSSSENQVLLNALKTVSQEGVLVLGPVGEPGPDKPGSPLSRTLLGQVPDAVIIGDLDDKESFPKGSFYGPEILTALKPPKEAEGPGAPSYFAARLTREWPKKSQSEWVHHFKARKSLSKRLWPGMDELFGR